MLGSNPFSGTMQKPCSHNKFRKARIAYEKRYGLEGYVVNDDFISFEDFTPIFYRECNPPFFPANLSNEEEKAKLWSLEQELKEAIKNEKVVDIDKLDKAYYQHILDYNKIKG